VILDNDKAHAIVTQLKARIRRIRDNKTGDRAPHVIQDLESQFYDCIYDFLVSAVNEFSIQANEHDKADLVQDNFLKINRSIMSFNPKKGKLHSWMTRIVKNTCIDWHRKKRPDLGIDESFDDAERPAIEQEFDEETFNVIKSFFPFYIPDRLIFDLLHLVEKHQFRATVPCVKAVTAILNEEGIDYTEYGKPVAFVQAIIMTLRGMLLTPMTDRSDIIEESLKQNPQFDALRVMTYFFGPKAVAQLVLLAGGMTLKLPAPQQFFKPVPRSR